MVLKRKVAFEPKNTVRAEPVEACPETVEVTLRKASTGSARTGGGGHQSSRSILRNFTTRVQRSISR
ncbi:hypothetical protein ABIE13_004665 [Ottowia thiooxydans]|uniref:Uncharacterized protein n=1 Tax=Ottowia thiooxydans TaxID=219182 RepID=A0ABV2QF53_9BURK